MMVAEPVSVGLTHRSFARFDADTQALSDELPADSEAELKWHIEARDIIVIASRR